MAEYNIQMNQLNSSGTYDTLYPITFNPTTGAMYGGLTNDNDIFSLLSKSMLFTPSNLSPVTLADLDEGALFSYEGLLLAKLTNNYRNSGNPLVVSLIATPPIAWNSNNGGYENGDLDVYLNGTYYNSLPEDIKNNIIETSYPIYEGDTPSSTIKSISRKIAVLSTGEMGFRADGEVISTNFTLPLPTYNFACLANTWTRTPYTAQYAHCVLHQESNGWTVGANVWQYKNRDSANAAPIFCMNGNLVITNSFPGEITNILNNKINLPFLRMETGNYIGTGTYGSGNPVSITLTHRPKFVIIVANLSSAPSTGVGYGGYGVFFCTGMVKSYSASNSLIVALPNYDPNSDAMVSLNNNVLSWYFTGNSPVLNSKYMLYTYYSFY